MQLVVTHGTADFDALASAVAAQKLYPGAVILLHSGEGRDVHAYLALHRDRFVTVKLAQVDMAAVDRLILVDVRRKSRLAVIGPLLKRAEEGELDVHVWDHHAATDDDIPGAVEVVERVGSVATLFVERMRVDRVPIDETEATLFVLGIYADTDCLTAAATSARDAAAVSWLLERGARMAVVNRYLHPALGDVQRKVLRELLSDGAVDVEQVRGLRVGFATVQLDDAPAGLADVTTAALELEPLDALFVAFMLPRDRTLVVARSRRAALDVGQALGAVGGGGHAAAASSKHRGREVSALRAVILTVLRDHASRELTVADAMSSPVHSVARDTSLRLLDELLDQWHHTGMPVVDGGELVGIVSRSDLEAARRRGHLDRPVSSCMAQGKLLTIGAEAPLEEAIRVMTEADVGRLPVMRRGRMIGIVTRSDARRMLYGREM